MKHAAPLEIEIKLRVPALEPLRPRLLAAGFSLIQAEAEETSVLWDRQGELRSQDSALRLRRYGDAVTLTWKGPRQADARLKIRPELETVVADAEAMAGILQGLGFQPTFTMVKRRSLWARGELEACLDQAPFGCFIELEGSREDIDAALGELGLQDLPPELRSYPALFQEHGKG